MPSHKSASQLRLNEKGKNPKACAVGPDPIASRPRPFSVPAPRPAPHDTRLSHPPGSGPPRAFHPSFDVGALCGQG